MPGLIKQFKYAKLIKNKPYILLRLAKALVKTKVFKKDVIRGMELAVTYQCQADCKKCSCRDLIDNSRRQMTVNEIVGISGQITGAGGVLINLTGGEPLLRNDILAIIEKLNKLPVIISLTTNGLLLTDTLISSLKAAGLDMLQISLNSPLKEEHDKEIGVSGSYGRTLSAIKEAREQNLGVFINTVVTKKILHSERMEKLANIAEESDSFLSLILPAKAGGWKDQEVNLNLQDYELIKKWLRLCFITTDTETCYHKGQCPAGTEKIYISPYGDIYPCPFIFKNYGNVLENGFIQLWEKMKADKHKVCVNLPTETKDVI